MFHSPQRLYQPLRERLREGMGRRVTGVAMALALEALLVLLLLTLGRADQQRGEQGPVVTTFDASSAAEQESPPEAEPEQQPERQDRSEPQPDAQQDVAQPSALPQPAPSPVAIIPLKPSTMARADISKAPPPDPSPKPQARIDPSKSYGPPNTGYPGDSKPIGTAPDGKPLYPAQWYRKPRPDELAGYLSTAQHPGWAIIACKTAPQYRVVDCVPVAEFPQNSNYARALLAAAWQLQVRPPQLGGKPMYGEWVRIRIYDETSGRSFAD